MHYFIRYDKNIQNLSFDPRFMQRLRVLIRFLSIESTVTPISTSHDQLSFLIPTIYIANDRFKIINEHDFSTRLVRHYSIRIKKKKRNHPSKNHTRFSNRHAIRNRIHKREPIRPTHEIQQSLGYYVVNDSCNRNR